MPSASSCSNTSTSRGPRRPRTARRRACCGSSSNISSGVPSCCPRTFSGSPSRRARSARSPTTGGRCRAGDAAQTLARVMVDGWPDARRFAEVVGGLIREARTHNGDRRVLAFGEMVALLWSEGKREAALRLEQLWNELARHEPFSLYCAYSLASFDEATYAKPFADIARAHAWVIPGESYAITDIDRRNRVIAALQQKATALEAESRQRAVLEAALRSKIDELG